MAPTTHLLSQIFRRDFPPGKLGDFFVHCIFCSLFTCTVRMLLIIYESSRLLLTAPFRLRISLNFLYKETTLWPEKVNIFTEPYN